jgi:hypothetical protein
MGLENSGDSGYVAHRLRDHVQVLREYRMTLLAVHRVLMESGGAPRAWNRLVNRLQKLHLELRDTSEGRTGITAMIQDPNPTVRGWAAAHSLFWDEAVARAELESQTVSGRLAAVDAKYTLRELDCGRLNMTWEPR